MSVLSDATANFRVPQKLDVIWTAQNYHDLHDAFMGPADVAALNKRFFDALKSGGIFDAESNALRNAFDDHKSSVFDRRVRGRTDQVVYKFRKPE